MKKLLTLMSALLFVFTATFLSADQGIEGNTIKIGSFLPLSGALGGIGSGLKVGMETYIKYENEPYNARILQF